MLSICLLLFTNFDGNIQKKQTYLLLVAIGSLGKFELIAYTLQNLYLECVVVGKKGMRTVASAQVLGLSNDAFLCNVNRMDLV